MVCMPLGYGYTHLSKGPGFVWLQAWAGIVWLLLAVPSIATKIIFWFGGSVSPVLDTPAFVVVQSREMKKLGKFWRFMAPLILLRSLFSLFIAIMYSEFMASVLAVPAVVPHFWSTSLRTFCAKIYVICGGKTLEISGTIEESGRTSCLSVPQAGRFDIQNGKPSNDGHILELCCSQYFDHASSSAKSHCVSCACGLCGRVLKLLNDWNVVKVQKSQCSNAWVKAGKVGFSFSDFQFIFACEMTCESLRRFHSLIA